MTTLLLEDICRYEHMDAMYSTFFELIKQSFSNNNIALYRTRTDFNYFSSKSVKIITTSKLENGFTITQNSIS